MKFNLKNRPKMTKGNMDRTLFLGKDVEEWFEGFEKELREMRNRKEQGIAYHTFGRLIEEILGE